MSDLYDRNGKPLEFFEWGRLFKDSTYKIVAQDKPQTDILVSTVWLGLDHQFGDGPPLIFETMVFGEQAVNGDQWQRRYSSEDEARAGHQEVLASEISGVPLDAERS